MKYRIQCDLCYVNLSDMNSLLNYVEGVKSNCASGLDNGESITRSTRYHFCQHDNTNPTRCQDYQSIDFDGVVITH